MCGGTSTWLGVFHAILGESGVLALYVELERFIEEEPAEPEDEATEELEDWELSSLSEDE